MFVPKCQIDGTRKCLLISPIWAPVLLQSCGVGCSLKVKQHDRCRMARAEFRSGVWSATYHRHRRCLTHHGSCFSLLSPLLRRERAGRQLNIKCLPGEAPRGRRSWLLTLAGSRRVHTDRIGHLRYARLMESSDAMKPERGL